MRVWSIEYHSGIFSLVSAYCGFCFISLPDITVVMPRAHWLIWQIPQVSNLVYCLCSYPALMSLCTMQLTKCMLTMIILTPESGFLLTVLGDPSL